MKQAMLVFGCALLGCTLFVGCAGVQAAGDTAGAVKGGGDALKGQTDDVRAQAKAEKEKAAKAKDDQEKKESGEADEDSTRLKAKDAKINTAIDDSVDFKKFDRNDWRKFNLTGRAGILTVEMHWDSESSNIDVDIFDTDGVNVGKSPPRLEGQQFKRVLVQVDNPGLYYVRVSAPTEKDASIYTLRVRWKGGQTAVAEAPPATPPPATPPPATPPPGTPPPATPPGTPPAPVPFAQDPTKVLGKIVTAYKEGSTWTLLIDKGSTQKVRSGMRGNVLDGAEGDKLLDGATFTISNIIDGSKSEAHASLAKPLGKNSRVVINLQ